MAQLIEISLGIIGIIALCFIIMLSLYAMFKLGMRVWDKIEKL